MGALGRDLRHAVRALAREPGFALAAILMLALGIGGTTTMYAAIRATLQAPLPYPDSERIVRVWETYPAFGRGSVSWPNFEDWRASTRTLRELTAVETRNVNVTSDRPERVLELLVTPDFFPLLGLPPPAGDGVLVSGSLWQRQLGGRAGTLSLDGEPVAVAGVLPAGFRYPFDTTAEIVAPFRVDPARGRGSHYLAVLGRLAPGATLAGARAELGGLAARMAATFPEQHDRGVFVDTIHDALVAGSRAALEVLLAAVSLVLLIACANVASLLLVRASARGGELALRMALGATPGRIARQLLTESLVLALLGGAAGALVPLVALDALALGVPRSVRALVSLRVDGGVLAFAALVSLGSVLLFGLVPALAGAHTDIAASMNRGETRTVTPRARLKNALVVAEVALSLVLDVGSGLLIRSLVRAESVDPGFDPSGVLVMRLSLSERHDAAAFSAELVARAGRLPGVSSAAVTSNHPLHTENVSGPFQVEGRPPADGPAPTTEILRVSPRIFATLRIPIVRGRAFTAGEGPGAPPVAIVNETFARRFLGEPLGARVQLQDEWWTVVGVVGDERRFGLLAAPVPETYLPQAQAPVRDLTLAVRVAAGDPQALAAPVREVLRGLDPEQPVYDVTTMRRVVADSLAQRRFETALLSGFGFLSLLLAALGTYAVVSYQVGQRAREIAIRMALGATPRRVVAMVLRQGMRPAIAGVLAGLVLSAGASTLLEELVYGVTTTDAWTFLGSAGVLVAAALLACWLPARRASRIEPALTMRR